MTNTTIATTENTIVTVDGRLAKVNKMRSTEKIESVQFTKIPDIGEILNLVSLRLFQNGGDFREENENTILTEVVLENTIVINEILYNGIGFGYNKKEGILEVDLLQYTVVDNEINVIEELGLTIDEDDEWELEEMMGAHL